MLGIGKSSKGSVDLTKPPSTSSDDDDVLSIASNDVADGEFLTLVNSLEEPAAPLMEEIQSSIRQSFANLDDISGSMDAGSSTSMGGGDIYGKPLTVEQASKEMPPKCDGDPHQQGQLWYATVVPDVFLVDGKLRRGLNKKDFDPEMKSIKPRRANLPLTEYDLFSSLTRILGPEGKPRYIFHGVLNGWPALQTLELESLEQKRDLNVIPSPKDLITGRISWTHVWNAAEEGARGVVPALKDHSRVHRAKLRAAPWTATGWSKDSLGFVFWFEAQRAEGPRVSYGTNLTKELSDTVKCTNLHMISHRYGRLKESPKDRLTYHSICLLEWEHGEYCTVVESAYLNGMGGYQGKSKSTVW